MRAELRAAVTPPVVSRMSAPDEPPPASAPTPTPAPAADDGSRTVVPPPSARATVAAPVVQRVETSSSGMHDVAVRDLPDSHVAELGDRLFDHIRTRLRAELLVDRERAGLIGDVR